MADKVVVLRDTSTNPDSDVPVKYVDNGDGTYSQSTASSGGAGDASEVTLGTRLAEATFTARVGEVSATPTANTLLARLKDIFDRLAGEVVSSTATRSNVVAVAADTLILAANTARVGAAIYNDTDKDLYLAQGTAPASTTSFVVRLQKKATSGDATGTGGYYEVPFKFTGQIRGIWEASPTGSARVTEFT